MVERIAYGGWDECYRLSNGIVEVVATAQVGPRLIRFGFVGGANEFAEFADQLGKVGGDEWRIYGGHRLWHKFAKIGRDGWGNCKNGRGEIAKMGGDFCNYVNNITRIWQGF